MKLSSQHYMLLLLHFVLLQLGSSYVPIAHTCKAGSSTLPLINVVRLLSRLEAMVTNTSFATARHGSGDSAVYGLLQCRGDVLPLVCEKCARDAVRQVMSLCGTMGRARVWFDLCYIRYDTTNFIGKLDTDYPVIYVHNGRILQKAFRRKTERLMRKTSSTAVDPLGRAMGTAWVRYNSSITIYAMAQCTRDLQTILCAKCLATATSQFEACCDGSQGGLISHGSCIARYEIYPFYYPLVGGDLESVSSSSAYHQRRSITRLNPLNQPL